jgi:hypothetical protein
MMEEGTVGPTTHYRPLGKQRRTGDNNDGLELITWLASKNIFQNFIDKKYLRKKETNTGGSRIEKIEYSNKIEQGDYIIISTLGNNSIYGKVIDNSSRGIEIEINVYSLFGETKVRQIYPWNNIISVTKTPKNYEKQIIESMTKLNEEFDRNAHIKWLQIPDEIIYTIYNSD